MERALFASLILAGFPMCQPRHGHRSTQMRLQPIILCLPHARSNRQLREPVTGQRAAYEGFLKTKARRFYYQLVGY